MNTSLEIKPHCSQPALVAGNRGIAAATRSRVKFWLLPIALLATLTLARANNNMRDWKLASGEARRAELVSYDEAKKLVILRLENQSEIQIDHDDLSPFDRAWLLEWIEFGDANNMPRCNLAARSNEIKMIHDECEMRKTHGFSVQ